MLRRSQLFVPANDERKIRKSVTLDADSIIYDLEDSVPSTEKSKARKLLTDLFQDLDFGGREVCVRINELGSAFSKDDVLFSRKEEKVDALIIPKAESLPASLHKRTQKTLIPLVETARGMLKIEQLVRSKGVEAISYGPADLANSVGGRIEAYSESSFVKTQIVVAASSYGVDAIDGVYFDLNNTDGFRREAQQSRDLGFIGKHVVHPSQILIANEVYSPSKDDVYRAKKLIDTYESSLSLKVGAIRYGEKLVDSVHYRHAQKIVAKDEEISGRG